jgi:hypothetical protein
MRTVLRSGWYSIDVDKEFEPDASGIYEWRITGIGIYVGKAMRLWSRIRDYPNNVRRMIDGQAWHGNPARDYRPIHYALRRAHDEGLPASVTILEICDANLRSERERYWIDRRRSEALAGGPPVLNSN